MSPWKNCIGMKILFNTWKYSKINYKDAYFEVKASYTCPRLNIPFFIMNPAVKPEWKSETLMLTAYPKESS